MRKKRDLALAGLMVSSILGLTVGCGNSKDKNVNSNVDSKLDARIEAKNGYEVSIRVYEDMEDHVATLGLYTIDSRTLKCLEEKLIFLFLFLTLLIIKIVL